jgi:hypothetical protein
MSFFAGALPRPSSSLARKILSASSRRAQMPSRISVKWFSDGSVCPICAGPGRGSTRYPGALCQRCEALVVDITENPVQLCNEGFSGGLMIVTREGTVKSREAEKLPLYVNGIACRAGEHHSRWSSNPASSGLESHRGRRHLIGSNVFLNGSSLEETSIRLAVCRPSCTSRSSSWG